MELNQIKMAIVKMLSRTVKFVGRDCSWKSICRSEELPNWWEQRNDGYWSHEHGWLLFVLLRHHSSELQCGSTDGVRKHNNGSIYACNTTLSNSIVPSHYNLILAAIIITAVISLIDYEAAYKLWKVDKLDFLACLCSFLGVLFISVLLGLAIVDITMD